MNSIRFKKDVEVVAHNRAFRRSGEERLIKMTARAGDEWRVLRIIPWDRQGKAGIGPCTLLLRGNQHSVQPDFIAGIESSLFDVVA